jgi:prepilin-type processing-associated H-X9-DG protein
VGDPDQRSSQHQPGGWVYNLLPFLDQTQLHQLGAGGTFMEKRAAAVQLVQTPLPLLNCPSRRSAILYPSKSIYFNVDQLTEAARSDYAACAGDHWKVQNGVGPINLMEGFGTDFWQKPDYAVNQFTGVIFQRSAITMTDLARGPSHTYLIGEKYLNPHDYTTGADIADHQNMYVGMANDLSRSTAAPPLKDRPGHADAFLFGGPHAAGVNMLYCDGSFRLVSYAVDPEVHRLAGRRQ